MVGVIPAGYAKAGKEEAAVRPIRDKAVRLFSIGYLSKMELFLSLYMK